MEGNETTWFDHEIGERSEVPETVKIRIFDELLEGEGEKAFTSSHKFM